jgi:hypothetical protein
LKVRWIKMEWVKDQRAKTSKLTKGMYCRRHYKGGRTLCIISRSWKGDLWGQILF